VFIRLWVGNMLGYDDCRLLAWEEEKVGECSELLNKLCLEVGVDDRWS